MKILISGGCKNGKSSIAERIALSLPGPHYYAATMTARDDEDTARIRRHREERKDLGFITIEQASAIDRLPDKAGAEGTFLVDALTSLLSNEMFPEQGIDLKAPARVGEELKRLSRKVTNLVLISDFIYSDALIYDEYTEHFRRGLAYLEKLSAGFCDEVLEICAGNIIAHKGNGDWDIALDREKDRGEEDHFEKVRGEKDHEARDCGEKNHGTKDQDENDHGAGTGGTMELIIGGAFQGQEEYAAEKYGLSDEDIYVCTDDGAIDLNARCIVHLEKYVLACVRAGRPAQTDFRQDAVLVSEDISCGIVPLEPWQRQWREAAGRYLARLAQDAEHVTRMFCGIPQRVK